MSNQIFIRNLLTMHAKCAIKDPKYWDVKLQGGEITINTTTENLCIETKDGYQITMKPMSGYQGFINGYVKIPSHTHLMDWVRENPSYDEMNYYAALPVEMTFFSLSERTFGWDHMHYYDADLFKCESEQPDKKISGPVQVLDEARQVIAEFRAKDDEIKMEIRRAELDTISEELMMKSCHPRRIAAWTTQGFDPFP